MKVAFRWSWLGLWLDLVTLPLYVPAMTVYAMARTVWVISLNPSNLPRGFIRSTGPLLTFPDASPWMWMMCEWAASTVSDWLSVVKGERLTHNYKGRVYKITVEVCGATVAHMLYSSMLYCILSSWITRTLCNNCITLSKPSSSMLMERLCVWAARWF